MLKHFLFNVLSYAAVIDLTPANVDNMLSTTELFLVNFYAEWCRFSKQLDPILTKTESVLRTVYPDENSVRIGRINCEVEKKLAQKFRISKYPTIKVFRYGVEMKKEYRGNRSAGDFMAFIGELMKNPVREFDSLDEANQMISNRTKGILSGYFESKDSAQYQTFAKVAKALQDDCQFIAGFDKASAKERVTGENIIFKDAISGSAPISEAVFVGALSNYELLYEWSHDKCIPLVREITFANGEELTEEGLPFLILFHKKDDTQSLEYYTNEISRTLVGEKNSVAFLHADCVQFSHPLAHLGKTPGDCPVIAIDSFKHMFLFPDFSLIHEEGRLLQFVKDLNSGKLHREFHNGPDEEPTTEASPVVQTDSIFKRLKPSKHRYSVHEEL